MEYDWYQTFTDYFAIEWRKAVETNIQIIRRSIEEMSRMMQELPEDTAIRGVLEVDKRKMEGAVRYYTWLNRLIDCLENGDIYQLVPKE
ncbi:HTH-type transcriptional repressor OpcR [compost metagenome]